VSSHSGLPCAREVDDRRVRADHKVELGDERCRIGQVGKLSAEFDDRRRVTLRVTIGDTRSVIRPSQ
jgi:hypothetical protein